VKVEVLFFSKKSEVTVSRTWQANNADPTIDKYKQTLAEY
jgi:hypothetical protein